MPQKNNKEFLFLLVVVGTAAFLRFFNLMHDAPYFFDPDERNMAGAITQYTLPSNPAGIISCINTQFFSYIPPNNIQPIPPQRDPASGGTTHN